MKLENGAGVRHRLWLGAALLAAAWAMPAAAQPKAKEAAAPAEIVIGHVAGFTGPVKKTADEIAAGAKVYIEAANAQGGVLGKKMRLVTADDTFVAANTVKEVLAMEGRVVALLPLLGSANMGAVLKGEVLEKISFPVLGAIPSQGSYHGKMQKNLFHFRASDTDQLEKIVEQLTSTGVKKIAIFAPNNPNGKEGAANIDAALQKRGLKLAASGLYEIVANADYGPQIKVMVESKPDAIIFLGPSVAVGDITKKLRDAGVNASLFAASYTDPNVIIKAAGQQAARGFAIAQVFPNPRNKVLPLVKQFRADFEKYGDVKGEPTYINLEGYIAARLVADAVRKTKDASPEGVRRGLEQLHETDLGGFVVDFSSTQHSGSKWVELSIIDGSGKLVF